MNPSSVNQSISYHICNLKKSSVSNQSASLDEERLANSPPNSDKSSNAENLTPKQRHQVKHRELFLSRQVEVIPANNIRGKCSVTLLNETELLTSYLNKDVSRKFQTIIFYKKHSQIT